MFFTKNLIPQLDPNPEEMRSYNPVPTLLEADILARVKNMLRHFAKRENQMEIWFEEFKGTIPSLIVDRELMERVICNLIINAIKYGDRGSTIRVEPRQVEEGYQVAVKNYGIGIEEEGKGRSGCARGRFDHVRHIPLVCLRIEVRKILA